MPSDDLISRMQALNGQPLTNVPDVQPYKQVETPTRRNTRSAVGTCSPDITLDEILEGTHTLASHGPGYLFIEKPAHSLEAEARDIYRQFTQLTGHPDGNAVDRIATICKSVNISPDKVLFLDIETTGLGMTPVFLIGTMECSDDGFMFRQYFARNYSEECSILSAVSEKLKDIELLVTFNGKTFDMPFIVNRAAAEGVRMHHAKTHLDLLYESRRVYKGDVPNCKLQTLERHICGRFREDDIPSSEIPSAYRSFVRSGNPDKIGRIIQHNLFDILTMADLMTRMWRND